MPLRPPRLRTASPLTPRLGFFSPPAAARRRRAPPGCTPSPARPWSPGTGGRAQVTPSPAGPERSWAPPGGGGRAPAARLPASLPAPSRGPAGGVEVGRRPAGAAAGRGNRGGGARRGTSLESLDAPLLRLGSPPVRGALCPIPNCSPSAPHPCRVAHPLSRESWDPELFLPRPLLSPPVAPGAPCHLLGSPFPLPSCSPGILASGPPGERIHNLPGGFLLRGGTWG